MRWFKHFTDNHQGRSVQGLMDEMGHTGPCCLFFLMEICAEKLERNPNKTLESSDCLFEFHERIVRQKLKISLAKLEHFLGICQGFGLLSFEFHGKFLKISMPMLLDLLEYDQKKSRQRTASVPPSSRLEKNRIEKNRIEQNREKKGTQKTTAPEPAVPSPPEKVSELISFYCDEWKKRYDVSTNPMIQKKDAGLLQSLMKNHGLEKGKAIVRAYLQMPDQWFLTKRHDIPTMVTNLNSIVLFMENGKVVTRNDIRQIEQQQEFKNQWERAGK